MCKKGYKFGKEARNRMSLAKKGRRTNSLRLNCEICNIEFFRPVSLSRHKHTFCSTNCYALWMGEVRKTEDHPLYRGIGNKNAKLYIERIKAKDIERYRELKRVHNVIYRLRRRGAGGKITKDEWLEIKKKSDFSCLACGRREPEIKLVADHIIPVVRWEEWLKTNLVGYNCGDKENIQPLCISCNCRKSIKLPQDYADKKHYVQKKQISLGYEGGFDHDILMHKKI